MRAKREVWILEEGSTGLPIAGCFDGKMGDGYAKDFLRLYDATGVVRRYVPAPAKVEGWPTVRGWYWITTRGVMPQIVCVGLNLIRWGDGDEQQRDGVMIEGAQFWGPLERPEADDGA